MSDTEKRLLQESDGHPGVALESAALEIDNLIAQLESEQGSTNEYRHQVDDRDARIVQLEVENALLQQAVSRASETIVSLEDQLAALREANRWTPITLQRPPDDGHYAMLVRYGITWWFALPPLPPPPSSGKE